MRSALVSPWAILFVSLVSPLRTSPLFGAATLRDVQPRVVSTAGGTQVTFTGSGFARDTHAARIGGIVLAPQTFVSETTITGTSPALREGTYNADIFNVLTGAVEGRPISIRAVAPPEPVPTVTDVDPYWLWTCRKTRIAIRGRDFTRTTIFVFLEHGTTNRVSLLDVEYVDSTTFRAAAPPHGPGRMDIVAREGTTARESLTANVAAYIAPRTNETPPPQQLETSIGMDEDGNRTARFRWYNPRNYEEILVLDRTTGRLLQRLPGDTSSFEMPASGLERVEVQIEGKISGTALASAVAAVAQRHECNLPPVLNLQGVPGDHSFYLRGAHPAANVARCSAPPPDGLGAYELSPDGQGAAAETLPPEVLYQPPGTKGAMVTARNQNLAGITSIFDEWNKAVTGFELPQPASQMEIAVLTEKLDAEYQLTMRGRLIHVYPDDGFRDEFSFPDLRIGAPRDWNSMIYYRADRDVADPEAVRCGLAIPEGTYRLELYAVKGERKLPYFKIPDSGRPDELFIEGVPCPPYPAVRVSDYTGIRTLPIITGVAAVAIEPLPAEGELDNLDVKLIAGGYWYDEAEVRHPINPDDDDPADPNDDPYVARYDIEYKWSLGDRAGQQKTTGISHGNTIVLKHVHDWGCYNLDITITDKACGFSKTQYTEVAILPAVLPKCPREVLDFTNPSPDPAGICALVGLDPPPGHGSFSGVRPLEFRVLVTPACACGMGTEDPSAFNDCPSAQIAAGPLRPDGWKENTQDDDFLFDLAAEDQFGTLHRLGVEFLVKDLCTSISKGPKYYAVKIEDLGRIPPHPLLEGKDFKRVYLQAKPLKRRAADGTPTDVLTALWQLVSSAKTCTDPQRPCNLWLSNRPGLLTDSIWKGSFQPADESYHFIAKSAPKSEANGELPPSEDVDIMGDVTLESANSDMGSGFTSRIYTVGGKWFPDTSPGTASGSVLDNAMEANPLEVAPQEGWGGSYADGTGASDLPQYTWCDNSVIFENHLETKLFDAILYTGVIGPVPVTIWASVGFGLDIHLESQLTVIVRPFAGLEGDPELAKYIELHFYLLFGIDLSLPCSIRCDVLGGIVSVSLGIRPEVNFELDTHVSLVNIDPALRIWLDVSFSLYMEFEACVFWIFCLGFEFPIVEGLPLIPHIPGSCDPRPLVTCDDPDIGGGDAGCADLLEGGGGYVTGRAAGRWGSGETGRGAGWINFPPNYQVTSAPAIAISPDAQHLVTCSFDADGIGHVAIDQVDAASSVEVGGYMNPSAAFIANDRALVGYSKTFCLETPFAANCNKHDWKPTLAEQNTLMDYQEIVVEEFHDTGSNWVRGMTYRISDSAAATPASRRVDGMCSVAPNWDPAVLAAGGEAVVVWVRYEEPIFFTDPARTVRIYEWTDQVVDHVHQFTARDIHPAVRFKLEASAIYARRVPLGNMVKISDPGINIEPRVAYSPAGDVAYCVWVHDPTHVDLLESNRGRFLKYSVYTRATDSWSAPQDVVAAPDSYPGILEPYIDLKLTSASQLEGLVAFTALDSNAPSRDTGLAGATRYVYASRLTNGVFEPPVRIHGKCQWREYGHWASVGHEVPDWIVPGYQLHGKNPEWVMVYQGTGPTGLRSGSGNVMVTVLGAGSAEWTPPVCLTPDEDIHSNVVATVGGGAIHAVNVNGGLAKLSRGMGGERRPTKIERVSTRIEPDVAILAGEVSNPFPYPGSRVMCKVRLENRGFAGIAFAEDGVSAVRLQLKYVTESGRERVVARAVVPEIPPGERRELELPIEMPHDPVRLIAKLDPNPIDRDRSNDQMELLFGSPPPRDISCESVYQENVSQTIAVHLSWRNPLPYEEILVYRDGRVVASLPGSSTRMIDQYVDFGEHTYKVRGRIRSSRSAAAVCSLEHGVPTPPERRFIRGDADADREVNITDPIFTLGYLFTGGKAPPCPDSADSDDNGQLEITDPILTLGFLFLGSRPPAPPGPTTCGFDVNPDILGPCVYTCPR
ncbi:MAG: IPT/TIG domain-containing protein [Planctomycetota bacterium]